MKVIKMIYVFISQPMNGRQTNIIAQEREKILKSAKKFMVDNCLMREDDELFDVNADWATNNLDGKSAGRLYYLGRSIQAMDKADFIIFGKGWYDARGCRTEEHVAREYFKYILQPNDCPVYLETDDRPLLAPHIDHIWFGKKG
jgi:hypothetical protein